ncbi:Holliday junction DNA helicase RuvA [Candidatus Roizmanbacteria bacterium RIFCSPHIGHO2_12_FULL_41_11]|uniref:Holliday junction branch migration complex subunit RuvA n=2 Tax=Candidatus Roizmaniibacteriota TaxID=1752723 RepID=A0A1F7JQ97_9BACT|nr:MAG: Holliday junction DNA helicase RuvA [Candidatus Roizmanbacteria bacterium RIFCSPHIGHO2_12_FULL_41_11]OGK57783.1 MAG: Holliday junction DNA helicase RuvA [Candidatus Roizmanbacteria bacterium RIFCSPLOWO2_02_FULL_41_9]
MIGKIKGILCEINGNNGLVETSSGVSYNLFLPPSLLSLTALPKKIEVYTYLQVREDALVLFGFNNKEEQQFFKLLLTVSGVGPKTAFTVISFSKVPDMMIAIKNNDVNYFTHIPGLGKKTAMKIILELSQKLKQDFDLGKMHLSEDDKTVVDALVSLGFKSQEAKSILSKITANLSVEEKVKEAIRLLTSKN